MTAQQIVPLHFFPNPNFLYLLTSKSYAMVRHIRFCIFTESLLEGRIFFFGLRHVDNLRGCTRMGNFLKWICIELVNRSM